MPVATSRMGWFFPDEGDDPYFDFFQQFAGEVDAAGFAFSDNDNLIITGSALFSWDLTSSTLIWDSPFFISGFTSGFSAVVPGPAGTPPGLSLLGAGNVDVGKHFYFVTFFDGTTETAAGPSAAILLGSASMVNVTLAIGPPGTIARRIYRTPASGFTLELAATIPNNVAPSFTDNLADVGLGAPLALTPVSQITLLEGQVMIVDMPRLLQSNVNVLPFAAARIAEATDGVKIHDKIVIAVRRNGVVYFRNGVALGDGGTGPVWERPVLPGASALTPAQQTTINAALHLHVEYPFVQPGTPIGTTNLVLPDASPNTVQRVDVFVNMLRITLGIDYSVSLANPTPTITLVKSTILNDQILVVAQISQSV